MSRPKTGRNGERTNLYLNKDLKRASSKWAFQKYRTSLSDLVERLLLKELKRKGAAA